MAGEIRTAHPIWKDKWINLGTDDVIPYTLQRGIEGVIYEGVAVKRPFEENNRININDIVSKYLRQSFPAEQYETFNPVKLYTEIDVAVTGQPTQQLEYRYDWSYDDTYNPYDYNEILCAPINGRLSPHQDFIFSMLGQNFLELPSITLTEIDAQGVETSQTINNDPNKNYRLAITPGTKTIKLDDKFTFQVTDGCEGYCLYYVNEYGGWDSLLLDGMGIRTDEYKRFSHKREYDNAVATNTGVVTYLNEITRKWELHTGYLTNGEGSRMHHLLSSPLVYLQDFTTDKILPVLITDEECRYKDYHNNGGQLVEYTINVEIARDYQRQ